MLLFLFLAPPLIQVVPDKIVIEERNDVIMMCNVNYPTQNLITWNKSQGSLLDSENIVSQGNLTPVLNVTTCRSCLLYACRLKIFNQRSLAREFEQLTSQVNISQIECEKNPTDVTGFACTLHFSLYKYFELYCLKCYYDEIFDIPFFTFSNTIGLS